MDQERMDSILHAVNAVGSEYGLEKIGNLAAFKDAAHIDLLVQILKGEEFIVPSSETDGDAAAQKTPTCRFETAIATLSSYASTDMLAEIDKQQALMADATFEWLKLVTLLLWQSVPFLTSSTSALDGDTTDWTSGASLLLGMPLRAQQHLAVVLRWLDRADQWPRDYGWPGIFVPDVGPGVVSPTSPQPQEDILEGSGEQQLLSTPLNHRRQSTASSNGASRLLHHVSLSRTAPSAKHRPSNAAAAAGGAQGTSFYCSSTITQPAVSATSNDSIDSPMFGVLNSPSIRDKRLLRAKEHELRKVRAAANDYEGRWYEATRELAESKERHDAQLLALTTRYRDAVARTNTTSFATSLCVSENEQLKRKASDLDTELKECREEHARTAEKLREWRLKTETLRLEHAGESAKLRVEIDELTGANRALNDRVDEAEQLIEQYGQRMKEAAAEKRELVALKQRCAEDKQEYEQLKLKLKEDLQLKEKEYEERVSVDVEVKHRLETTIKDLRHEADLSKQAAKSRMDLERQLSGRLAEKDKLVATLREQLSEGVSKGHKLEAALVVAETRVNSVLADKEKVDAELCRLKTESDATVRQLKTRLTVSHSAETKATKKTTDLTKQVSDLKATISKLEANLEASQSATNKATQKGAKLTQQLAKQKSTITELETTVAKCRSKEAELIGDLTQQQTEASTAIAELESSLSSTKQTLATISANRDSLDAKLSETTKRLHSESQLKKDLAAQLATAQQLHTDALFQCDTLRAELSQCKSDHEKKVDELTTVSDDQQRIVDEQEAQLLTLQSAVARLETEVEATTAAKEDARIEMADLVAQVEQSRQREETSAAKCADLEERLDAARTSVESLTLQTTALTEQIRHLEASACEERLSAEATLNEEQRVCGELRLSVQSLTTEKERLTNELVTAKERYEGEIRASEAELAEQRRLLAQQNDAYLVQETSLVDERHKAAELQQAVWAAESATAERRRHANEMEKAVQQNLELCRAAYELGESMTVCVNRLSEAFSDQRRHNAELADENARISALLDEAGLELERYKNEAAELERNRENAAKDRAEAERAERQATENNAGGATPEQADIASVGCPSIGEARPAHSYALSPTDKRRQHFMNCQDEDDVMEQSSLPTSSTAPSNVITERRQYREVAVPAMNASGSLNDLNGSGIFKRPDTPTSSVRSLRGSLAGVVLGRDSGGGGDMIPSPDFTKWASAERLRQLNARNEMQPPALKSSYPGETMSVAGLDELRMQSDTSIVYHPPTVQRPPPSSEGKKAARQRPNKLKFDTEDKENAAGGATSSNADRSPLGSARRFFHKVTGKVRRSVTPSPKTKRRNKTAFPANAVNRREARGGVAMDFNLDGEDGSGDSVDTASVGSGLSLPQLKRNPLRPANNQ